MNLEQVRQFAKSVGTNVETVSGEWARMKCPLSRWTHDSGRDSNPSCGISYGKGIESAFHCWACESGDLHKLILILDSHGFNVSQAVRLWREEESEDTSMVFSEDVGTAGPDVDQLWDEEFLAGFMLAHKVPMAREYLHTRRVSAELSQHLDIRWDLSRRAVCFPVRNWSGQLVGLRGRYISPVGGLRYHDYGYRGKRNKLPWYGESTVNMDQTVLMVESVFDYASAKRVYSNVLAPLTVGLSHDKCQRVRNAYEIVTLFDNGKGGDKGRTKISERLTSSIITHVLPPSSVDDPGDMTKKQLRKVLKKHIILNAQ